MGKVIPEPQSLEEAKQYIGKHFWKFFRETGNYYEGIVEGVDDVLETESGTEETGIFFRVVYPADDDREHLLWSQLSDLLAQAAKYKTKRKSADKHSDDAAEQVEAAAANKRSRRSTQQQQQQQQVEGDADEDMQEDEAAAAAAAAAEDEAASDYEPQAAAAAGRPGKRGRQQQQQPRASTANKKRPQKQRRQQQLRDDTTPDQDGSSHRDAAVEDDDAEEEEENYEAAAAAGTARNHAGRSRHRQQEEDEQQQQQQQQQQGEGNEEEEEEEEVEEVDGDALERMLREQENEVVAVRVKGLAGHLKSVQVQNFMCHRNFAMDFGTHVNVVSGSNGSGKSAVLQALQVCLGVQARKTGRGEKLQQFVRSGCHEAKVQVTLWNTGEDAYQHERYGDSITVERSIKISGTNKEQATSTWRLLDCHGRKVSDKKKELTTLLDHLNIDAANPLAVMTQDTSRNFLCGSVADKKKYELFMEATMLDDMRTHLRTAQGYVQAMKAAMVDIREMHKARHDRVGEFREKLKKLEESASMIELRDMWRYASLWAMVEDNQSKLQAEKHKLEVVAPQRQQHMSTMMETLDSKLNLTRQKEETLAKEAADFEATQASFTDEMRHLAEELKQARAEARQQQRAFKGSEQKLNSLQAELRTLLETKKESSDDRQREFAEKLQQYQAQIAAAQREQDAAHQLHQQQDQQVQDLQEKKLAKEAEIRTLQQKHHVAQQTIVNMEAELRTLQAAKGQKLALFGQHAQLRHLVDSNKRSFEQLPIGPIGAHLTLTNTMWEVAAEVVLGSHLEKWIVTSTRDEATLRRLAGSLRMKSPVIIVANFARPPYNLPSNRQMPAGWQSMRQFVVVEHPTHAHIIDNKLMDLSHYESVVVDQEERRCANAVYERAAGPGVTAAVHVSGRQWTRVRRAITVNNYWGDRRPRIGTSFESSLNSLRTHLAQQQGVFAGLQEQLKAAHGELQQLTRQIEALAQSSRKSLQVRMKAQHKMQTLQTQMPVMEGGDDDDDGDMLAEQQRSLQQGIADAQLAYDRAKAQLEQAHLKQEQARQLQESRKAEIDEMLNTMGSRTDELLTLATEKATLTAARNKVLAELQVVANLIVQLQQSTEAAEKELQESVQEALKHCEEQDGWAALETARALMRTTIEERLAKKVASGAQAPIPPQDMADTLERILKDMCYGTKGVATYTRRFQELEKRIATVERDAGGNKEDLKHQLEQAEADFNRHEPSVRNMNKVVRITDRQVVERCNKYEELFDDVQRTVSNKFMAYMHRRGHQGKVKVDRDSEELKLLVKVNVQGAGSNARNIKAVKDLKQLSGGERSFTTVAFILALGEFTESPFRAMDEFDVFMDAINRRIATQTLLEFAREKGHLQFVFLTPQDLQAVEDAKRKLAEDKGKPLPDGFVKVVQMQPARPGQH